MSIPVVLLLAATCLGLGTLVLAVLRLRPASRAVHWALAFALGHAVLGWLVFPLGVLGLLSPLWLWGMTLAPLPALAWLPRPSAPKSIGLAELTLLLFVAVIAGLILAVGLTPPTDADSLAYHFALPRQFLAQGQIVFVPRAVDGAIPLLVQMTYLPALALGGERAMTLWASLSSLGCIALLAALARPHLGRVWTLAACAVAISWPAFVYGAPSGQIESKVVMYVLAAAWAANMAVRQGCIRHAALAGLAAGSFAAAKYTGLLLVAAVGLALLWPGRRWLGRGLAFGVAVLVIAWQWYWWNWLHTSDPVFPMLFETLRLPDGSWWNADHHAWFKTGMFGAEIQHQPSLWHALAYPIEATLWAEPKYESLRTGFGPLPVLLLPFALAGAWSARKRLRSSALWLPAVIVIVFYALFYFSASSQRIRHLLPVAPLALLLAMTACRTALDRWPGLAAPVVAAMIAVLIVQLGAAALFARGFLQHLAGTEVRSAFLTRMVPRYPPVEWVNAHLPSGSRLFFDSRQLAYYLPVNSVMGHQVDFAAIAYRPGYANPDLFLAQLRGFGVTHLLVYDLDMALALARGDDSPLGRQIVPWLRSGCMTEIKPFQVPVFGSRTLNDATGSQHASILAINEQACPPDAPP